MHGVDVVGQPHRDAGRPQRVGVGRPLVAQRVVLARSGSVPAAARRGPARSGEAYGSFADPGPRRGSRGRSRSPCPPCRAPARSRSRARTGTRRPCRPRDRSAPAARSAGRRGRAPSGVTTAARLPPALSPITASRAASAPSSAACSTAHDGGGVAVLRRGRVRVLGRQPVVDRDDDGADLGGDRRRTTTRTGAGRRRRTRRRGSSRSAAGDRSSRQRQDGRSAPAAAGRRAASRSCLRPRVCRVSSPDCRPGQR